MQTSVTLPAGRSLRGQVPQPSGGLLGPDGNKRLLAGIAALIGVFLTGLTCLWIPVPVAGMPVMMGAIGSVSVLLFVLPWNPFSQPWAIIGGNTISAIIGVTAALLIPQPIVAAAVAVSGAILAMSIARCLHPPGGASALAGVMGGQALASAGYAYPLILFIDTSILVMVGYAIHFVMGVRYPDLAGLGGPARATDPVPIEVVTEGLYNPVVHTALQTVQAQRPPISPINLSSSGTLVMKTTSTNFIRDWRLSAKVTALTAIALIILSVITFGVTRHILTVSAEQRAVERQETNMRVAWDVLAQYGGSYSLKGDEILVGDRPLNSFFAPVDRIKTLVGGTATIFRGDTRVTTNVKSPDGSRAIGTALTAQEVREAVLVRGESYRGRADILGRSFFTAYDPIKDASGKVIGILYVGIPTADFLADVDAATMRIAITGLLVTLIAAATALILMRRMFAPLTQICEAMGELAQGHHDIAIQGMDRGDEIGTIARSVAVFRDAAIAKEAADVAQQTVVENLAESLHALAKGDLTIRIEKPYPADYAKLRTDFNDAVSALDEAMVAISVNTGDIRQAVIDLSRASDDLARRTETNAASVEETSAAMDEMTQKVRETSDQAASANRAVSNVSAETTAGASVVQDAVAAMRDIEQSSGKISNITGVIDSLAFQTNLLALNAGVEAARAGDAGAGFAVVAAEVRALAQRSADAASEIKGLIKTSTAQVGKGTKLVDEAGGALTRISGEIDAIGTLVAGIASSAVQQSGGLRQVNEAVGDISQMSQQNAANVEENNAVIQGLAGDAATLETLVGRFVTSTAGARGVDHRYTPAHGVRRAA